MTMTDLDLDAEALYAQLEQQVKAGLAGAPRLAIVGIYSGGAWLAERLARSLGVTDTGNIDVSFYRDDYAQKGLHPDVVLYTGRTTRAAINTLFDYGRPAKIMLAALIDRGGRQLPVAADYVAKQITVADNELLILQKTDDGRLSLTVDHA